MKQIDRSKFNPNIFKGIAHRGLHDETHQENSLSAFKNAIDNGYCFELDVHLSKDGELIVSHDYNLMRMTGKNGVIEDLTLEQIRSGYKLLNGEDVPTLKDVLDLNDEKVTVVIELKSHRLNGISLAKKVMEALKNVKDPTKISLISFDPWCLMFCNGRFTRGLIVEEKKKFTFKFKFMFDYIDVEDKLLTTDPVMIYRKKGGLVNTWTIKNKEAYDKVRNLCDMVTFEGFKLD